MSTSVAGPWEKYASEQEGPWSKYGGEEKQPPAPKEPGILDKANEYAGKALGAAGLPTSISDIPNWGRRMLGQDKNAEPFWKPAQDAIQHPSERSIVNAVPVIGPSAVSMSDDVRKGDYGGALSTLAGTVAPSKMLGEVRPGLGAAKSEIAEAARTPENKLTPTVKHLSKVAGAATGGFPGYFAGPSAAEAIIPKRPEAPNFYGGALEEPVQPVLGPETPTRSQFRLSQKIGEEQNPQAAPAVGGGARPTPDVIRIPEPREPLPGEKPGYTASTPRRLLLGNAQQGRPGAGDMLRNNGKTVIYTPPEGYPGPRQEAASEPEIELMDEPVGARSNASGAPGGGGLEEQSRMSSENAQGVKYFRENPGGGRQPLVGLGRQDLKASPGQRIIRVDANGGETVLDAQPVQPRSGRLGRTRLQ